MNKRNLKKSKATVNPRFPSPKSRAYTKAWHSAHKNLGNPKKEKEKRNGE